MIHLRRAVPAATAVLALAVLLSASAAAQSPSPSAAPAELIAYPQLILVNGKIITVDEQFTIAEAVAIRDGRILAVGSAADIRRLAGPQTRTVDLAGRSVVPGFIDSDADNAFAGGDLYKDTMVNGRIGKKVSGDSVAEMLRQVEALVATAAPGTPVFVRMADEWINDLAKLTLRDADAVAPANPLMLAYSSSEGLVNSLMLQRAFAAGLPQDHVGVVRDAGGRPTGQLFGAAIGMVGWNLRDWPELTDEIFAEQEALNDRFLRVGVTTVTGHASGYTVTIMSHLFHQGRLHLRIRPDLDFARQNPLADQFLRRTPNVVNFSLGDGMVRIVGAAVGPVDGASDDGGILTNEPKVRVHPEIGGGPYGRNKWTGTTFTGRHWADLSPAERMQTEAGTLYLLRKHGWNIGGNHNMGSQASRIVLETLADAARQPDIKVKTMLGRNALDHNLIWDASTIELAKQLGDSVAFGLNSELWSPRIVRGEEMLFSQYGERLGRIQPVKDLVSRGVLVHLEGGKPDEPPLWRIERFITRMERYATRSERASRRNPRAAGTERSWGKEQAIDRREALRLVTIAAARFISEESSLGSIEKGKYADLVVLDGDYMAHPEHRLSELEPVMTIVGGKVVFEKSGS
ncbi:MAG TPA: amidohydrolase family protein [Vicinamibacterales bacterium]|nr:amidohydrolase family protein [Vicinamibacterales bacterium]